MGMMRGKRIYCVGAHYGRAVHPPPAKKTLPRQRVRCRYAHRYTSAQTVPLLLSLLLPASQPRFVSAIQRSLAAVVSAPLIGKREPAMSVRTETPVGEPEDYEGVVAKRVDAPYRAPPAARLSEDQEPRLLAAGRGGVAGKLDQRLPCFRCATCPPLLRGCHSGL